MQRVQKAAARMRRQIDGVGTFYELKQVEIRKEEIEGREIVKAALDRLFEAIHQSNAHIDLEGFAKEGRTLSVDKQWSIEAVYPLISNAIKFSVKGVSPRVAISPYSFAETERVIGIAVCDRGIGVPSQYANRIFTLFERAVGQEVDGVGAGLAIAAEVAGRHGGKTWVNARAGGGSEFIINFEKSGGTTRSGRTAAARGGQYVGAKTDT